MTKPSLSRALLLAGLVAAAGYAQADTFDSPQQAGEASTMTLGAPNQLTTNSPYADNGVVVDTTILGAAPATVTTYSYSYPAVTYVQPNTDTVVTQIYRPEIVSRTQSAATFNVPSRAGEASTMTGGAPNMSTDNTREIINSRAPVLIY